MPDRYLTPPEACRFLLEEYGIRRTPATLAKGRVMGGNVPPYRKVNRSVLYALADLRAWASAALSVKRRTTSDPAEPSPALPAA